MKKLLVLLLVLVAATKAPSSGLVRDKSIIFNFTVEERIVRVLKDSGFSRTMQRIILAQAKFESGGFRNSLTRKHNNIFAMMHPGRRQTRSLGPYGFAEGRKGYASYSSIEESVQDYLLYKKYKKILDKSDVKSYVYQLKSIGYFTDDAARYTRGVERWLQSDSTVRNFSN